MEGWRVDHLTAQWRVCRMQEAYLGTFRSRPGRHCDVDPVGHGILEADTTIERRVAFHDDDRLAALGGRGHDLVHQRRADATPLRARQYTERRQVGDGRVASTVVVGGVVSQDGRQPTARRGS